MFKLLKTTQSKVSLYSNILMVLTSVHHAYGAMIYHTPWRLHILFISVPVMVVTLLLNRLVLISYKSLWTWIYGLLIFLASVLLIGSYEGLYNHVLKNILYFGGLSAAGMATLFPPGMYELPNDVFFEITGMLQGIVVIPLAIHFMRWVRLLFAVHPVQEAC